MLLFEILLLGGLLWLGLEVGRLRRRVSELEVGWAEPARAVAVEPVPFATRDPAGEEADTETAGPTSQELESAFRSASGAAPLVFLQDERVGSAEGERVEFARDEGVGAGSDASAQSGSEATAEPAGTGLAGTFERLIGGRLLIWVGGAALALSGLFLVRYSIELGLIGPGVRMTLAALLGASLVGAGEWARVRVADDPRVAQALVGAGVLILYAAAYGGHVLYGLYGLNTAFALMALVALGGLALALRHGWPTAALGLVGAFAAPALLADVNAGVAPLLGYLLLVNLAVLAVARARGWRALLGAAVLGTTLWTLPLGVSADGGEAVAVGLFILGYAVAASLVLGRGEAAGPPVSRWLGNAARPALFGLVQLALFTVAQGYQPLGWALFLPMCLFVAWRSDAQHLPFMPTGAAMLATVLLFLTTQEPDGGANAWILMPLILLCFLPIAGWRALRGDQRPVWTVVFAITAAGPPLVLRAGLPDALSLVIWGLLLLAFAALPIALAARLDAGPDGDTRRAGLLATAATLAGGAVADLLVPSWQPLGWMLLAVAAAAAARRWGDRTVGQVSLVAAGVAALGSAVLVSPLWRAIGESLAGVPALVTAVPGPLAAVALLGLPAASLALVAERLRPVDRGFGRSALGLAAVGGVFFAYAWGKQVFALADYGEFIDRGLAERTLFNLVLFGLGWLGLAGRIPRVGPDLAWGLGLAFTALAAARFVWFELLLHNPAWVAQRVGTVPFFNWVLLAFGGAGGWLLAVRQRVAPGQAGASGRKGADTSPHRPEMPASVGMTFLGVALTALVFGALLLVRQLFQGSLLHAGPVGNGENMGYTVALLLLSVALLFWGWTRRDGPVRLAGLALLTATVVKAFGWDAAALEGVLRILSFLALGLALIGVGRLYGKLLRAPAVA